MSTPSTEPRLTPAQKRKRTIAANAEKERRDQAVFAAQSKAAGGRKAKVVAKDNAKSIAEEAAPEVPVAAKVKGSGRTKSVGVKVNKLKAVVAKAVTRVKSVGKAKPGKVAVTKAVPARVVADSASEAEAVTSDDSDKANTEVPRVIAKKFKAVRADSDKESDVDVAMEDERGSAKEVCESDQESIELSISKPRTKSKNHVNNEPGSDGTFSDAPARIVIDDSDIDMPQDLRVPDSDAEDGEDVDGNADPVLKRKVKAARPRRDSDMDLHEAIAKGLTAIPHSAPGHRSSTASRQDVYAVDSDADESVEEDNPAPAPKKARKVSAARHKQAEREVPSPVLSMFPAPGKDIGLTGRTEELKAVLRGCIEFIKLSLLFEDAYPAIIARAGFARSYLISAAQARGPAAVHIKNRLETNLRQINILSMNGVHLP
ncbi:hypothetical protein B0H13DRAFT_1887217 [Mycena leptocephala]|nr:hypothetical protein B0H13DRAFT_1887217 [Mycena leptocephala]